MIGWDIFTPDRSEGVLSMLLSTTWFSQMEPWPGGEGWHVSTHSMPMSDASEWRLWYRDDGSGRFRLGAPPFLDPAEVPHYVVTDSRQRQWSFSQPYLIIPEPPILAMVAVLLSIGVTYGLYGAGIALTRKSRG